MEADWDALRAEYLDGDIGLRALAARHGLPPGRVTARARREGWAAARRAKAALCKGKNTAEPGGNVHGSGPAEDARVPQDGPRGAPGRAAHAPLANLSRAADNVVLLADRAARGLVGADGRVDLDGLAKVAKILKDARDTQMAVLPAGSTGAADDGFAAALNARAAEVWEEGGDD